MSGELSKDRLTELAGLAAAFSLAVEAGDGVAESACGDAFQQACTPEVILALVAAARERDELRAQRATHCEVLHALVRSERSRAEAAEKERDELAAKVEALREQLPEIDDLAFNRGRDWAWRTIVVRLQPIRELAAMGAAASAAGHLDDLMRDIGRK